RPGPGLGDRPGEHRRALDSPHDRGAREARQRRCMKVCGVLFLVVATGISGCGYQLSGTNVTLPSDVHTVAIGPFDNRSREFGLEKTLAFAREREFHRRGILTVAENPDQGDALLSGVIKRFHVRPVAFNSQDEAIQYEAEIVLDLILQRQSDGSVLWKASSL